MSAELSLRKEQPHDEREVSQPAGLSFDAKFDGKEHLVKGDPGVTSVSLKKIDESTIEETDKRDGKLIYVIRYVLNPDGNSMRVFMDNKEQDSKLQLVARKKQ